MVKRIAEEVLIWNVFLAAVFLVPPLVLSLEKPRMPAPVPAYEPAAALQNLGMPCDYLTVKVRSDEPANSKNTRCVRVSE